MKTIITANKVEAHPYRNLPRLLRQLPRRGGEGEVQRWAATNGVGNAKIIMSAGSALASPLDFVFDVCLTYLERGRAPSPREHQRGYQRAWTNCTEWERREGERRHPGPCRPVHPPFEGKRGSKHREMDPRKAAHGSGHG